MPALLVALALLLSACVSARQAGPVPPPAVAPAASSSAVPLPLEQIPAELSVAHFSRMRLTGTGLTLTKLEDRGAYVHYAAEYRSNGLLITGIMNVPKGDGPFPLVMTNHGYIATSVYTRGRGLKREQDYLARKGFAVFHSDYRGHAGSDESPDTRKIYDAGLEYSMDVVNAVAAIREARIEGVDATTVGMLGHSMGGGVSLNIAVARPGVVDALVLYAPVNADAWENFWRWRREREEDDRTATSLGTREENPEVWDALSSRTHLAKLSVPVLLFQGALDKDVPKEWSDRLADDLRARGKDVTYVEYEREGHEFAGRWSDFMEKTAAFFETHLKTVPDA